MGCKKIKGDASLALKVVPSAQSSHFCGVWERVIGRQPYPDYFGEADSRTRTNDLSLLEEGTCHCTKARALQCFTSII